LTLGLAVFCVVQWRGFGSEIHGTRRPVQQNSVVNFIDLAQREAASPPPPHDSAAPKNLRPTKKESRAKPTGRQAPQNSASSRQAAASRSPAATDSFLALDDDNTAIPPDVGGAAGPNHLMTVHNTQVRIQDRSGNVISTVSLNSFWASLNFPDTPDVFDPKIIYDPAGGRWIFTAFCNPFIASSSVLLGVTQTNDPTGSWNLFRLDADVDDVSFADYPSLGFTKDWIVVSANMFDNTFQDFVGVNFYVFDKAALYSNTSSQFTLLQDNNFDGFSICPAITYDQTATTMYLVEDFDNFNGQLRISTITGEIGKEVLTLNVAFPTSPDVWSFVGDEGSQLGSTELIDNGDSRIQNVIYRNGFLWCTHAIYPAEENLLPATIQWWQLTTAGAVVQRGRIGDSSGASSFAFPSIAVNSSSDCLIGYSRFSATQFASGNYAFRFGTDPPNTFRADVVLKSGEASYFKDKGSGENRWGDYSSTVVDPVNDRDFWTIQQFAATPVGGIDRWGTWWGRIVPAETGDFVTIMATDKTAAEPGFNTATMTVRRSSPQGDLTVNYSLSGKAVNGTDYQMLPGSVVIPSGALSAKITITPIDNNLLDGDRTVIVTLTPGSTYSVGNPSSAKIIIGDNEALAINSGPTATPNPAITGTTVVFSAVVDNPDVTAVLWDFGDGTQDENNRLIVPHGYQAAGDYQVTLLVTHRSGATALGSLTVTVSDDLDGDGIPDVIDPDIDNDGFPNDLEIAFGSDPEDPDSTPTGGGQGGPPKPLRVTRFMGKLDLKNFFHDSLQLSGSLPLEAGTAQTSQTLIVDIGGVLSKFVLDKNGRGTDGTNQARLSIRKQKLLVPKQDVKFQIKFSDGDFASDFEDEGINIDNPAKDQPVKLDVLFLFQGTVFHTTVDTLYTATPLKFGTLKMSTKKTVK
jgi:hypothetical protein